MSDLFVPVCPAAGECLLPRHLGCGLRLAEQSAHDQDLAAAFALLIARAPETPFDRLGVGAWAGRPVALVNETAPAGAFVDAPGLHGGRLFDALDLAGDGGRHRLTCRAGDLMPVLESALGVRYRRQTRIIPTDGGPIEIVDTRRYRAGDRAAARRDGLPDTAATRPALNAAPDLDPAAAAAGPPRLIACLEDRSYLDPEAIGQAPSLGAILRGPAARAVLALAATTPGPGVTGRWAGRRIWITADADPDLPTTAALRADPSWRDLSERAAATLADMTQSLLAT